MPLASSRPVATSLAVAVAVTTTLSACTIPTSKDAQDNGATTTAQAAQSAQAAPSWASTVTLAPTSSKRAKKTVTETVVVEEEPAAESTAAEPRTPAPEPYTASGTDDLRTGQIGGDCGTTAAGVRIKAASATSCEFAKAVYDAALKQTFHHEYAGQLNDVAEHRYTARFTAVSPVTGGSYQMVCQEALVQSQGMNCVNPAKGKSVGTNFSPEIFKIYNAPPVSYD